jgi:hypothetical protein
VIAMIFRIIGRVIWINLCQAFRAIDRCGFVELLRYRLQRGQIHDQEEWRAVPHIDQDDGKTCPVGIAQPRDFIETQSGQDPIER